MARPLARTGMSESSQREVVWHLARGCNREEAAKRAGISSARVSGFSRSTEFAHALRQGLLEHMANELAPRAVRILDEIMTDKAVNPRVRVDAAKALLDRAGYPAASPGQAPRSDLGLNEISVPELQRIVKTLEEAQRAEAAAAKTIEGTAVLSDLAPPAAEDMLA